MKTKKKLHITERHKKSLKHIDLFYYSIKQVKYFNPYLVDFVIKGYEN